MLQTLTSYLVHNGDTVHRIRRGEEGRAVKNNSKAVSFLKIWRKLTRINTWKITSYCLLLNVPGVVRCSSKIATVCHESCNKI